MERTDRRWHEQVSNAKDLDDLKRKLSGILKDLEAELDTLHTRLPTHAWTGAEGETHPGGTP
jgi:hypothetical protein